MREKLHYTCSSIWITTAERWKKKNTQGKKLECVLEFHSNTPVNTRAPNSCYLIRNMSNILRWRKLIGPKQRFLRWLKRVTHTCTNIWLQEKNGKKIGSISGLTHALLLNIYVPTIDIENCSNTEFICFSNTRNRNKFTVVFYRETSIRMSS